MLDDALAAQLKQITLSDIAFGGDGQILAATLPRSTYATLADRLQTTGRSRVQVGAVEYEVLPLRLAAADEHGQAGAGPVALILRSRTEQLRSLEAIRQGLEATAVVAVLLATVLSFAVARTIARPLAAITDVMRSVAVTGDLTRKIAVGHRSRWDDEDARLLATTFNTLTDSIVRFQRQMSQKERLTSLGRLSTVIAHEIRNPLMIIKATLHAMRRTDLTQDGLREAVGDIDEEVARLNRIVNDVLDFARPIRFELATVDLNALCRESVGAVRTAVPGAPISVVLDPSASTTTTDPERLRMAVVNLLQNACHAVNGHGPSTDGSTVESPPFVRLTTHVEGDRVRLTVTDSGGGINPADLAQIFDPYFTTKRGGTGLGLPIVKNIVEGLGGTIAVASTPGRGTEIQIDLPLSAPAPTSLSLSSPALV
jgi:signal transduction histidine kinase